MYDENSAYPRIKTGYGFIPHMNDIIGIDFNKKIFNQDGNDS